MDEEEFEQVVSIGHGALRFLCYEVSSEGMERAVYVSPWEPPGSYIEGGKWREPDRPEESQA